MFEMYVESEGKKLRCGYTTGSCSAGAAKAATLILFEKVESLEDITIITPNNIEVTMPIYSIRKEDDYVECSVLKFSGDDPDITNGLEITARVRKIKRSEELRSILSDHENFEYSNMVYLNSGVGVGTVTKEGLFVPVGEPAINPVPRKMIREEVASVLPNGERVEVIISVPRGEEISKKTFNPRLGIKGGISILGTKGIVYPMSEDALKSSIKLEISQKSLKNNRLILTFGNLGEKYCKELGYKQSQIIIISNYVGYALECCMNNNIESVVLIGHIGKMSKIAYGCFNTHSRVNGVRLEVFALELALLGYDMSIIKNVLKEKTCEGAVKLLGHGYEKLYSNIGNKIVKKMEEYVYEELKINAIMYYGASNPTSLWSSLEGKI